MSEDSRTARQWADLARNAADVIEQVAARMLPLGPAQPVGYTHARRTLSAEDLRCWADNQEHQATREQMARDLRRLINELGFDVQLGQEEKLKEMARWMVDGRKWVAGECSEMCR